MYSNLECLVFGLKLCIAQTTPDRTQDVMPKGSFPGKTLLTKQLTLISHRCEHAEYELTSITGEVKKAPYFLRQTC